MVLRLATEKLFSCRELLSLFGRQCSSVQQVLLQAGLDCSCLCTDSWHHKQFCTYVQILTIFPLELLCDPGHVPSIYLDVLKGK